MGTECWLVEHGYCRLIPIQEGTCYFLSSHQFKWVPFLTVTGKYLSLTITEQQEATFLGNFDVLFNNTAIGGYLPYVTEMYFQRAPTQHYEQSEPCFVTQTPPIGFRSSIERALVHFTCVQLMVCYQQSTRHPSPMVSLRRITSSSV